LHGSQCGFCTPGIVMSLFAHYHSCGGETSRDTINDVLAGNLCRCTGYRPIVDSALDVKADMFVGDEASFFAAPANEQSFARLYVQHPDATIVAGATDVGLWITKKLAPLPKIIHVGRVAELDTIEQAPAGIALGAVVSLAHATPALG